MTSIFDLTQSVAVVTGGNGGIGLGMAHGLAAAGAGVAIWGRDASKNARAVADLRRHHTAVESFVCDVTDEGSIADAFAATLARFDAVDACFANAGISGTRERFHETSLANWRRVVDVNLLGVVAVFAETIRHLRDRDAPGSLVATSSTAAIMGVPRGEHYAATKTALQALVRSLAVEYGRYGIRANAVVPGWVETAMTEDAFALDRFQSRVLPRHPLGRWGKPDDFAGIAVYLASDASRWHTGDAIVIDGGYTKF
ncbi:MAG: SDR family NAD(P)-dependent oxidoreductase [Acidimicrobiia bacterium]